MRSQKASPLRRLVVLGLVAALAAGCQSKSREPRRLAFPTFQAEALFPEYQSTKGLPERAGASAPTQFAQDLNPEFAGVPASEPEGQNVPLGSAMIARIPSQGGWTWSLEDGATLIVHAPSAGRPGALVYAEPFSPAIHDHPSAEHLRFQITIDPDLAESYLKLAGAGVLLGGRANPLEAHLSPSEAARWAQLLKTKTLGRGLGFRPTRGTFTGWRWVGRNAQGVTLRCGRHLGVWSEPRLLPAPVLRTFAGRAIELDQPASTLPAAGASSSAVSASLILGSATDRDEETGVHFAVLCVREPRCLAYKELAQFLDSIQTAEGSLLERLRTAPPIPFQDLAQQSGLKLLPSSAMPEVAKLTGACDCSADLHDCPDFRTHEEAQACLEHCKDLGSGDIHRLDQDNDGDACECDPRKRGRCVREW